MAATKTLRIARAVSGALLIGLLIGVIALSWQFGPTKGGTWQSSPLGGSNLVRGPTLPGYESIDFPMLLTLFLGWVGLFVGGWLLRGKVEVHPEGILIRRFLLSEFHFFRDIKKLRTSEDARGVPFFQLITEGKASVIVRLDPNQSEKERDELVEHARALMKKGAEGSEQPLPTTTTTFEFRGVRATVGSDGILLKSTGKERLVGYARLAVIQSDSPKLSPPLGRARWSCSLRSIDGESLVLLSSKSQTVHEFICAVRARIAAPVRLPPRVLQREEQEHRDWVKTLRGLGKRGGHYRDKAFDAAEAKCVLEGRGGMVSRVAAAVALGREEDLRVLASDLADGRMRRLLEQVSVASDDDEFARAMMEIEQLEAETEQRAWC